MPDNHGDNDELYEIKAHFFIGNYQTAINEAQKLKIQDPELKKKRDELVYRSFIALKKYSVVCKDIQNSTNVELHPLKDLAEYLGQPAKRQDIVQKLELEYSGNFNIENHVALIVAGTILYLEGSLESALKILHQSNNLECHALMLQILLKMDRLDMAKKQLKLMQEIDDDAVLTQLTSAWVNLSTGGEKLQEAYYTFEELADKHAATPSLLNGQATCLIGQGKYEEAEAKLQEALEKDSNNTETLINMTVLSHLTGKSVETCNRSLNQLSDSAASVSFTTPSLCVNNEFQQGIASYQVNPPGNVDKSNFGSV
uniref:Coatomer subunit epsilon n=1 Tax=Moina brachiata TaxID=675436 RepID=A0A4Y7NJU0_9CRUS|nr:EOG090X0A8E [Moina brachiata]SVE93153.1 EOG090X0A8E [Moina brachiata]